MPDFDFLCDYCRQEITNRQTMSWYLLRRSNERPWAGLVFHYPACARWYQDQLDPIDSGRIERVALESPEVVTETNCRERGAPEIVREESGRRMDEKSS